MPQYFSGCLGTKYLKEDEKLLYKQKISGNKPIDSEDLSQLYAQRPNRQFPIIPFSPYVWFYYHGVKRYDREKYEKQRVETEDKWDRKLAENKTNERKLNRIARKRANRLNRIDKNIQEGNVWMRWGEPVAVYDTAKTRQTHERFLLYASSKGYFLAKVDTIVKRSGKRVRLDYHVTPGPPYKLDTLFLQTGDTAITKILEDNKGDSFLKVGDKL